MAVATKPVPDHPKSGYSRLWTVLPAALLLAILGLDWLQFSHRWGNVVIGLLDEPAHLATGALVLLAVAGPSWLLLHRLFACTALFFAMAIDADHIPYYLGVRFIVDDGRPLPHSLATVLLLLLIGAVLPVRSFPRLRPVVLGAGAGVALHLIRDVGNGPGLPLFWPFTTANVIVPYGIYAAAIVLFAVLASVRMIQFLSR
jgi:inner membrane protein